MVRLGRHTPGRRSAIRPLRGGRDTAEHASRVNGRRGRPPKAAWGPGPTGPREAGRLASQIAPNSGGAARGWTGGSQSVHLEQGPRNTAEALVISDVDGRDGS